MGRHGALRRPGGRWVLPEPGALRRRRHLDHAQDPARAARRHHPDEGRARKGDQFRHLPRPAGRPADARHRRQGRRPSRKQRRRASATIRNKSIANARVLARVLAEERGLRVVSGRTESHVFLLDLRAKNITGKEAEAALGRAHITVNKNGIPNDPQKPFVTSGIRIGSPAMTTRGFTEIEAEHGRPSGCRYPGCAERRSGGRYRARQGGRTVQQVPGLRRLIWLSVAGHFASDRQLNPSR